MANSKQASLVSVLPPNEHWKVLNCLGSTSKMNIQKNDSN